jgi:hypothetical protein
VGQAERRGTFEERRAKAIERNKEKAVKVLEAMEKKDAELTTEERQIRTRDRIAMLSFLSMARHSGLSIKEVQRRVKRHNKKSV